MIEVTVTTKIEVPETDDLDDLQDFINSVREEQATELAKRVNEYLADKNRSADDDYDRAMGIL